MTWFFGSAVVVAIIMLCAFGIWIHPDDRPIP